MADVVYECSVCKTVILKGPQDVVEAVKDITKCQKCNNAPIVERK